MLHYDKVYKTIVSELRNYILKNNIETLVLGISGGIDSTVCAAICHAVSQQIPVGIIGRSITIVSNKDEERNTASLVGNAFCSNFKEIILNDLFESFKNTILLNEGTDCITPISQGNIKCRMRMIYLYHLASVYKGMTIDTDNLTEHNLGFFTVNGDVFDYNPIGGLWKTEVYEFAKWLVEHVDEKQAEAINTSIALTPTDGLGISNSDLDQIGCRNYQEVDKVLNSILNFTTVDNFGRVINTIGSSNVDKVMSRHNASAYKRLSHPIVIPRSLYE